MENKIYLDGQFQDIESIIPIQSYPLSIKCIKCNEEHNKFVCISKEKSRFRCFFCNNQFYFSILPLKMKKVKCLNVKTNALENININLEYKDDTRFLVGKFVVSGCEILDIPRIEFSVVSNKFYYFEEVYLDDGSWHGKFKNFDFFIDLLSIKIEKNQR